MAPVTTKRRRVEDEVRRPKKKVKKVKKQTDYHSSSEDDDDIPENAAFDAPKVARVAKVPEVVEPTGGNAISVAASRPKPILKKAVVAPVAKVLRGTEDEIVPSSESEEEEEDEDNGGVEMDEEVEVDEVAKNTALNLQVSANSDDEEDEDLAEDLAEDDEPDLEASSGDESDNEDEDDDDASHNGSESTPHPRKKRNDPTAFATSITKILSSKLTTTKRTDPVLSRSKSASDANKTLADEKLTAQARRQQRSEKKQALEKGRVKDVLGLESDSVDTGGVVEEERRLRKTAQRGVVKLFNAVRAAQVKGEEAGRAARAEGVVGMGKRGERASEMSKQGFLDLISAGGK